MEVQRLTEEEMQTMKEASEYEVRRIVAQRNLMRNVVRLLAVVGVAAQQVAYGTGIGAGLVLGLVIGAVYITREPDTTK